MFEYTALVVKVIDGDTIDVCIDLGFGVNYNTRLRLYGINTPETRTKNESIKERGIAAKNKLKELIENKTVTVKTIKDSTEKYGRYLAVINFENICINEKLLTEGYAVKYLGK